jgi:hypothetical protein
MYPRSIETRSQATNARASTKTVQGFLQTKLCPTRTLKPSVRNARTHSKKQIRQIAASISALGWTYPILIDEGANIIAGNGRFLAAVLLGLREVPVMTLAGLTETHKRALAIADNKIAANAGWDRSVLAAELGDLATLLPEMGLQMSITGFEAAEFDALAVDFSDSEQFPAEDFSVGERAVSQVGGLWVLGHHRLLCGNACEDAAVKRLMARKLAKMLFADPPYNVRIGATVGRGKTKYREFAAASGEMSSAQFTGFLAGWMKLAARYSDEGSIHFVCIDWRHIAEMHSAGTQIYSDLANIVVWVKTNAGQGSLYRSQHELIFVFKNGDAPHQNHVELGKYGRHRSNVWRYAGVNTFRACESGVHHPTVKPIELVADAMRDCSRRGEIILSIGVGLGPPIGVQRGL